MRPINGEEQEQLDPPPVSSTQGHITSRSNHAPPPPKEEKDKVGGTMGGGGGGDGWAWAHLVLVLGDAVAGVVHLRDEHLHGGVAAAGLLERVLEPALHAVAHHLRQRLPLLLHRTAVHPLHVPPLPPYAASPLGEARRGRVSSPAVAPPPQPQEEG